MSFWKSEMGEVTGNADQAFAKSFTQIPDGTKAVAKIKGFANQVYLEKNFKYLAIEWELQSGDFKGQKVVQKLKVYGGDEYDKDSEKTRYRALNMLKLLYQLFNLKPNHYAEPTDQDLAPFVGKIAGIKIRETAPNDKGRQYNWVSEVHKSEGFTTETGTGLPVVAKASVKTDPHQAAPTNDFDDIPF